MGAATCQSPELDLDDVDESQHEEDAPRNGAHARDQHSDPEDGFVDPDQELGGVEDGAPSDPEGLLEAQGDEAGEEEGAEGVDVEGDEVFGDGVARDAVGVVLQVDEGVGRVARVPCQPDEHGQGEQRVHVDDSVQGRHVDARAAGR